MAKRIDTITELYDSTIKEVAATPKNWTKFLRSACRNYRLPFDEQILVYKQRPDATAVLEMKKWNERFGRWVKRDSVGIAVLDKKANNMCLKYYFDVSDTKEGRYSRLLRPVPLWKLEDSNKDAVEETLVNSFGLAEKKVNLPYTIMVASGNAAEDNITDYMRDILRSRENSLLEGVDDYSVEVWTRELLANSVAYMVMTRCDIDVDLFFEEDDFRRITEFNTPQLTNLFGVATSDVSEMVLSQVADTITKMQMKEKSENRTFAGEKAHAYNETVISNMEGSVDYGVQETGRLHSAGYSSTGRTGSTEWEVRISPQGLSKERTVWDFHNHVDAGGFEQAPDRDTRAVPEPHDRDSITNGREIRSDGGNEEDRPDEVGGNDEQYPSGSGGNGTERDSLQLAGQSDNKQQETVEVKAEEQSSAFSVEDNKTEDIANVTGRSHYDVTHEDFSLPFFHDNDDINEILLTTPHLKATKEEIRAFYERNEDVKERTEYIKSIFNDEYTEIILSDGRRAGYKTYDNVLHLWQGSYLTRTAQSYYHWEVIAGHFEGIRLLGQLKDKSQPLLSVEGQLSLLDEIAEENTSAFSFTQEIIDFALKSGSSFQGGKYRIYSYFMQGHSNSEKEAFLKKEYGEGGRSSIQPGTGIAEKHSAKGIVLSKGYKEKPSVHLKWKDVIKRIDELIALGQYMSKKELEYLPEYERKMIAQGIYFFYSNQPEEVMRPYPFGTGYDEAVNIIRPQLDNPERVGELLKSMREVLANTADFAKNYQSMQNAYQDLQDYSNGTFSLFTPIANHKIEQEPFVQEKKSESEEHRKPEEKVFAENRQEKSGSIAERLNELYKATDIQGYIMNMEVDTEQEVITQIEKQLKDTDEASAILDYLYVSKDNTLEGTDEYYEIMDLIWQISELPAMNPPYDLQVNTLVAIGTKEYTIDFISSEMAILRDKEFPLFTEELSREELESRVRDNPDNNHLMMKLHAEDKREDENIDIIKEPENKPEEEVIQEPQKEEQPKEQTELVPQWEKKPKKKKVGRFDLHPEVPKELRNEYRITDNELGYGTQKEKFRANMDAIRVLKQCEAEDRYATKDEQRILSKYVGWGGLSDAFDENKSSWSSEYKELKEALTEEEYEAARQSTLTAFYTPPVVIRAIYQTLENMGLKSGNILEPSCAVGNFIGMKPESLSECNVYGVEIDSVSGRIATQLYQKSTIAIQGYEDAELPDSFFDVAVGNVPFGQFKINDRRYDKHNFLIHDYFFAKTLDKVRPGGVIAFITSLGTMDKKNPAIRKYIAQRAELLGAIRLPNDTFKKNAGTEVTADIIFLQKRDRMIETEPGWIYLDKDENGISQNRYFIEHPEMVLGEMVMETTQYGMDSTCRPYEDKNLEDLLNEAISNIQAEVKEYETEEIEEDNTIPADPSVPNFSFTIWDGKIYYRNNSRMSPVELSVTGANRVRGMIAIRDCVRRLIEYQTEGYSDEDIKEQQEKLNHLYDVFRSKYGLLNSRGNSMVFSDDNSYPLLCSLEIIAEDGTLERKADMFTKRTIKPHETITSVDTASEALSLSLSEKARVDMDYMCSLTGKTAEEIETELSGVIFRLPGTGENVCFVAEDEYLSGNVREKLSIARLAAKSDSRFQSNVQALEKVQPKDLSATEISVRLGTTWIPTDDIEDFIYEILETPNYLKHNIRVRFSSYTGEWQVEGKSNDKGNVRAINTYGTHRANAYKIIEDSLNLRDTRIFDYEYDENGKKQAILNKKETAIAQGKQDVIKQAFQDWIWKDPERRQRLTDYYNKHFNAMRPREYDGSHLHFYGMNPEIDLRQHQKNGVARIIFGGNTLLAYVVGAGKTYTMVAAAMESKRLGLCSKSMIVVPNHIIEQFASEWLQLYPAANILVATKKDFETKNRKKFCAKIATSDIDAVIIGHSQFEKIPLSAERQRNIIRRQIDEITEGIRDMKMQEGSRFTVKTMERMKKNLQEKLKKLNDQSRKDTMITFEELGVDRLFVDEADNYKNLFLYTKMRNVGGIAQTEAQKSSDMFMKCQYLDELTGGKGVIFSTGTPVSNSMVELYTMQRYLQYETLVKNNLQLFDAWASTFGETVTAIELAPEGSGYRLKTRFAKFYNLPELMTMFREVADIQTADMLNLPVPEAEYRVISVKPSEMQKEMVETLGERAERVRNNMVSPQEDNMLLITNDGRKIALDQRLTNEMLPDEEGSKINACVDEIYKFWLEGTDKKLTQLVFCDLSTPKNDETFSVYNDVRDKLIAKGIPREEIAFIHNANTEVKKKELFSKVRRGAVRILMGSTAKMGAGTNVQDRIIASHDLDCPWRPRDLEQRAGRTVRQGNMNPKVDIIRYVTEGTFDAYLYQIIENKQKFISQIMTSKSPARTVEDIDEVALSYAEIKALASGNPMIKEKMDLDVQVSKLQLLKNSFLNEKYELQDKVTKQIPNEIKTQEGMIAMYELEIALVKDNTPPERDVFPPMQIKNVTYTEKKEAGQAIIDTCKSLTSPDEVPIGAYRGLTMYLSFQQFTREFVITLKGNGTHYVTLGTDIFGNITRIDNEIEKFPERLERCRERLETAKSQLETARVEAEKEFPREEELKEKMARLGELNALLDMDKKAKVIMDDEQDGKENEEPQQTGKEDRER